MGEYARRDTAPVTGPPSAIADHIAGLAAAGAAHVQLVVDPITPRSVESVGAVLALLDAV